MASLAGAKVARVVSLGGAYSRSPKGNVLRLRELSQFALNTKEQPSRAGDNRWPRRSSSKLRPNSLRPPVLPPRPVAASAGSCNRRWERSAIVDGHPSSRPGVNGVCPRLLGHDVVISTNWRWGHTPLGEEALTCVHERRFARGRTNQLTPQTNPHPCGMTEEKQTSETGLGITTAWRGWRTISFSSEKLRGSTL
jgi:hypothetical protein